ncbi:metallophosphoesterase family protein [Pacificimonas flava]|uniref:metallophosphoesterase family protein n=1 Tax=Pacificimonas flava TaxID=1234595 RepID=UPI001A9C2944|nr:metallophosphoesterase family protein [Pacificimonas flava]
MGDIHGRRDLLDALLERIAADLKGFEGHSEIVFLGDYIDRGPDSAGVIDRLIEGPEPADSWVYLKGNHDHFATFLLEDDDWKKDHLKAWISNGGDEALKSWGVSTRLLVSGKSEEIVDAFRLALPKAHRKFFRALKLDYRVGDYLFVHAGIRPGVPLEEQDERDLMWIRGDFLRHRKGFGVHVVHGHTISKDVDEQKNRTGIDTGAYMTGTLTALVLEGAERRYIATD